MIFGQRFGDPLGHVEPSAINAQIDPDQADARVLSFTPERSSSVVYHCMIDGKEFWRGEETSIQNFPQDARDHIQIIETSLQNRNEDLENVADSPLDRVKLTWPETPGTPSYYEIWRKEGAGDYAQIAGPIAAGQTSYEFTDGPLHDAVWTYKVRTYDAAGNYTDSSESAKTISAAPEPPSDLALAYTE